MKSFDLRGARARGYADFVLYGFENSREERLRQTGASRTMALGYVDVRNR